MGAKQASMMRYDQQGDLHITVPRTALKKFEASVLFQVVRDLQKSIETKRKPSWEGDSIARINGMSDSGICDGADNHDLYLYGEQR
ncbi:MAG: hypothetical protein J0665_02735 [Deltaproteobacteria bacterium]|jgi:hypothetical protein|nr:hypothetical protein [Deltaproteobacteria bacterium]